MNKYITVPYQEYTRLTKPYSDNTDIHSPATSTSASSTCPFSDPNGFAEPEVEPARYHSESPEESSWARAGGGVDSRLGWISASTVSTAGADIGAAEAESPIVNFRRIPRPTGVDVATTTGATTTGSTRHRSSRHGVRRHGIRRRRGIMPHVLLLLLLLLYLPLLLLLMRLVRLISLLSRFLTNLRQMELRLVTRNVNQINELRLSVRNR